MNYYPIHHLAEQVIALKANHKHVLITGSQNTGKSALLLRSLAWMPWPEKRLLGLLSMWKKDDLILELRPPYKGQPQEPALLARRQDNAVVELDEGWKAATELAQALLRHSEKFCWIDEIGFMDGNHSTYAQALLSIFAQRDVMAVIRRDRCFVWDHLSDLGDVAVVDLDPLYGLAEPLPYKECVPLTKK